MRYLSVRRGTISRIGHDVIRGSLRTHLAIRRYSLERVERDFPTRKFSLIAVGPPCGPINAKVRSLNRDTGVTHRRVYYGVRSTILTTGCLLGCNNEFYVYRHPRELISTLRVVHHRDLRPGQLHFIISGNNRRPFLFLIRNGGGTGPFVHVRPLLRVGGRGNGFASRVLGVCNSCTSKCSG